MITLSILMLAKHQPFRALLDWTTRCAKGLARSHERREAIKVLQGLDDHLLKDIGITRSRVEQAVHGGITPVLSGR